MPKKISSKIKQTRTTHDAWKMVTAHLAQKNCLIKVDFKKLHSSNTDNERANALISAAVTAAQLGVSPKTLANWRALGTNGPQFTKIGSRVFYRQSAINAFITSQSAQSTSEFV